ncbi:ATP-binding protein [Streptomyces sp. NPDC007808]|uniref:ATP-binding protein n=1 Tax=Streptomyces sp. NPDC007808 TaxID=3364779 RepID=UPI0036C9B16D
MKEPTPTQAWKESNREYLIAELAVLRLLLRADVQDAERRDTERALAAARLRLTSPCALDQLTDGFGLSAFERSVLLLTAGAEFVAAVSEELKAVSGSPEMCFGTALAQLPEAHWSALTPSAPLRRWGLVQLRDAGSPTRSALVVDERVLHHLAGTGDLDPALAAVSHAVEPPPELPGPLRGPADAVAQGWKVRRLVLLHGPQRANLDAIAAAAAASRNQGLLVIAGEDIPVGPLDGERLLRLMEREAVLSGQAWAIDVTGLDEVETGRVTRLLSALDAPATLLSEDERAVAHAGGVLVRVPRLPVADRRALLSSALRRAGAPVEDSDTAAGVFDLAVPDVEAAAREAAGGTPLWRACRERARPSFTGLAKVVVPRASWDDLVLPVDQWEQLRALVGSVRHRTKVLDDWGFAGHTSRGVGTTALFAGPSGTGKTLAAEVVAGELELDLVHIDLSGVVSKYIGETEKHLRRVFAEAENCSAVLLFDEAEALFGRRTEVRDARDRYANLEVGYLLQRLETFSGLAILTTNARAALDPAFTRRLGTVIDFPYPDRAMRAALWRVAFPPHVPVDGLDPTQLAGTDLTGGAIAAVARSAAYLAAAQGSAVSSAHVRTAMRWELAKAGRSAITREEQR